MATAGLSYEELQHRKKILLDELQNTQNRILDTNTVESSMDIHHPERSQGWKPYRYQEYPKMLYHPIQRDPLIEDQRLATRRRNEANPNLAPLDLPHPKPLARKVLNKAEEDACIAEGFVKAPPQIKVDESGLGKADPLAASMGVTPREPLSIETVLKLNMMGKDELMKHAKEVYDVVLPGEASKVDIISAIAKR